MRFELERKIKLICCKQHTNIQYTFSKLSYSINWVKACVDCYTPCRRKEPEKYEADPIRGGIWTDWYNSTSCAYDLGSNLVILLFRRIDTSLRTFLWRGAVVLSYAGWKFCTEWFVATFHIRTVTRWKGSVPSIGITGGIISHWTKTLWSPTVFQEVYLAV